MYKSIAKLFLAFLSIFIFSWPVYAQKINNDYIDIVSPLLSKDFESPPTGKIAIYFFHSKTCIHCAREQVFLDNLLKKHPQIELLSFEVSSHPENVQLLRKVGEVLGIDTRSVPLTVIGDRFLVGYFSDETTGKEIEQLINTYLDLDDKSSSLKDTIYAPIIGEVSISRFSLPAFTIILGLLDGFNPCAMWALLFLIGLLLGMKNRKRMWILGTAFIVTSATVYYLFMAAWLNFFLFIGFIFWVRFAIGGVALASGFYNLREFNLNRKGICKVTQSESRMEIFVRFKEITQKKELLFALIGILLLAFAVNLIELVCSAGLPAVYTRILTLNNLSTLHYYLYLLLYIFFFMIDDLFVFIVAMITLKVTGIQSKYSAYSRLIGGVLMLIIGLLLIFKIELLTFG